MTNAICGLMQSRWKSVFLFFLCLIVFLGIAAKVIRPKVVPRADSLQVTALPVGSAEETAAAIKALQSHGGMILPKRAFLVAGEESAIFFRDIVGARDPEVFRYSLSTTAGFASVERRAIRFRPTGKDVGRHTVTLLASTMDGKEADRKTVELVVVPRNAGWKNRFRILMVGDSLGHQSMFPNELHELFARPGNPRVEFVGTFKPAGAKVPHEQYGGWQFVYFTTVLGVNPKDYHRDRSPFVWRNVDGTPTYDFGRYISESLGGHRPDYIHIQLGTNDIFALTPQDPALDEKLNAILRNADILISGMRKALPAAIISVGTVIQANSSDRSFVESYRAYPIFHSEWRFRQVQTRFARKMLDHFDGREKENILMVPTHMTVDAVDGYDAHAFDVPAAKDLSNAVHPTQHGARQLAGTIYAVLKAHLAGAP